MDAQQLPAVQLRLQDCLRGLLSSPGDVEAAALPALKGILPQLAHKEGGQAARGADAATKGVVAAALRKAALDVAQEAAAKGQQPPMRYVMGGAGEPAMRRLLSVALLCSQHDLMDPAGVFHLLDELAEASTSDHNLGVVAWLEEHARLLSSGRYTSNGPAMQQLTRLCNGILKRLGKHDALTKARLLMLSASITPLMDRSGVGVTGAFAPPDPPLAEEVPPDAVDSTGRPVNVLLYRTFWELQALLQDPLSVLASADRWSTFKKDLPAVLAELARTPATVPASRAAAAAADGGGAQDGGGGAGGAQDGGAQDGGGGAGGAMQSYLSSYRLFGLQLTDSSFRRDFLVQVLIMLRTLLIPGRVPAEGLKPKQRMEALAMEEEVFKVLEATPRGGREFCRAVREVLEREATWVAWKKGGKDFVVPGKEQDQPPAAAAGRKQPPPANTCIDWTKPPAPPVAEAVAAAAAAAAKRAAQKRADAAEGLSLKRECDLVGRQYDNGGTPLDRGELAQKRRRYVRLLDNGSGVTLWAQARVADRSLQGEPLLSGLWVREQPGYPTAPAVCAQLLRELDPDAGVDREYMRAGEDAVYRWRLGRLVAQQLPETEGLENQDKLTAAVVQLLPEQVPKGYTDKLRADAEAAEAAAAAAAAEAAKKAAADEAAAAAAAAAGAKAAAAAATEGKEAAPAGGGRASSAAEAEGEEAEGGGEAGGEAEGGGGEQEGADGDADATEGGGGAEGATADGAGGAMDVDEEDGEADAAAAPGGGPA